ncbi:hypothetical protein [Xylella fastidiosa]|uniref:Uncharacterized protein n=1 Tax=Xylella fastidiosa subsp. multiplex TaxID=644357 RepID=A0A9Q4QRG4_XYLFS|nr:hypothetical protein [Xylella fastidiosa]KAJ4853359.1 hypothetical protein XYFPCFBP8418_003685 [Xylella fastidiosa subsp. multiplex]MBE0269726.1 hypothetical protein [Xylella fastidiosa subsp. multiplex]MBE0276348.1 hypothetical protein [Xylella fastidiosa subsp. multiplex]MBE0278533.1 hypothetical protein [Xylella fastidiosa subsp. multiplex]MBE0282935.1 hypothetical protein [Xylella fastidiosa subsp. multiplex]
MADPVAWTFAPGGEYTETFDWLTDVLQAPTGGTQHRRLRQSPRATLRFSALESGASRRWMDVLLRAHSAARWWVPIAIDARALAVTAAAGATTLVVAVQGARFTQDGHVLIIGPDPRHYEVHRITALGEHTLTLATELSFSWGVGTRLYPVRLGRLSEPPQVGRFTADDSALVSLQFRLEDPLDSSAVIPGATYRGYPVFDTLPPVWTSDPVWVPHRHTHVQDDTISTPWMTDTAGVALGTTTMQYAPDDAAAILTFRSILFALAGRWAPVWVPSWIHDLPLAADVRAGQRTIDILGPLLSTPSGALQANRRDIRIALYSGAVWYRRITAVTSRGSQIERLTLDSRLPAAFTLTQVKMISFITFSVQDADTAVLRYFGPEAAQCQIVWKELHHAL